MDPAPAFGAANRHFGSVSVIGRIQIEQVSANILAFQLASRSLSSILLQLLLLNPLVVKKSCNYIVSVKYFSSLPSCGIDNNLCDYRSRSTCTFREREISRFRATSWESTGILSQWRERKTPRYSSTHRRQQQQMTASFTSPPTTTVAPVLFPHRHVPSPLLAVSQTTTPPVTIMPKRTSKISRTRPSGPRSPWPRFSPP